MNILMIELKIMQIIYYYYYYYYYHHHHHHHHHHYYYYYYYYHHHHYTINTDTLHVTGYSTVTLGILKNSILTSTHFMTLRALYLFLIEPKGKIYS
jgi:hypothetical protein